MEDNITHTAPVTNNTIDGGSLSVDYEMFGTELNVSNENHTNYSFPWSGGEHSMEEYVVEWNDAIYPSGYSHLRIIMTSFFVTVIMILIVVGNMLVCIAIATEKALKTVQNWFIASLAVSDFLVGLIVMPFSLAKEVMGYWIFGRIWCEIHSALDVFLCTASINSLCLISLDRYWSVTHAVEYLKKRTPRRSIAMIGFVWVLSAVISLPPLVGWKKPDKPTDYPVCLLSDDIGYVLYSAFGSFYVPAFVMVFVYCKIFVVARSRARRHLKKKQAAAVAAATEFTNDPVKDKSTTTTTCTSFSNPSPPDRSKDFESFCPIPELPKIPESNGTNRHRSSATMQTPEIVIESSSECTRAKSGHELPHPTLEELLPHSLSSQPGDLQAIEEAQGLDIDASPKKEVAERRMLLEPRLQTQFGSSLSLAEIARSEEDVSERSKKKKKKVKVKYQIEEVPKRTTTYENEKHKRRLAKARERRATLILGLIMASFILAWLPFFVLYVLEALCKRCEIGPTGFAIAFWLGYCNSALNPIIYTIFNRDFRKAFRKILFK